MPQKPPKLPGIRKNYEPASIALPVNKIKIGNLPPFPAQIIEKIQEKTADFEFLTPQRKSLATYKSLSRKVGHPLSQSTPLRQEPSQFTKNGESEQQGGTEVNRHISMELTGLSDTENSIRNDLLELSRRLSESTFLESETRKSLPIDNENRRISSRQNTISVGDRNVTNRNAESRKRTARGPSLPPIDESCEVVELHANDNVESTSRFAKSDRTESNEAKRSKLNAKRITSKENTNSVESARSRSGLKKSDGVLQRTPLQSLGNFQSNRNDATTNLPDGRDTRASVDHIQSPTSKRIDSVNVTKSKSKATVSKSLPSIAEAIDLHGNKNVLTKANHRKSDPPSLNLNSGKWRRLLLIYRRHSRESGKRFFICQFEII